MSHVRQKRLLSGGGGKQWYQRRVREMTDIGSDSKVFIGGLSPTTTKESLLANMAHYGDITDCKVVMDKQTGKSKGYGFVVFASSQQAESSVEHGFVIIDGKQCNCNLASLNKKTDAATFQDPTYYDFSKRQRTDQHVVHAQSFITPIPMDPQIHMTVSLQTLYSEFQNLKYEVTLISQNVHQLQQTIGLMKTGLDALLQRNGIIVPTYVQ
eukprot:TRINITY_DN4316_c0_g1_i5.p1 TRINITY_DN4316_c0_g1~~TRINITY_DN4316_c0_g1_i5.p1  ORF type:complete len:211 (-),score=49.93 TRINITY_DN4316_c0_g1_i5:562-1194(-)